MATELPSQRYQRQRSRTTTFREAAFEQRQAYGIEVTAVIAIIITIMVLEMKVPHAADSAPESRWSRCSSATC